MNKYDGYCEHVTKFVADEKNEKPGQEKLDLMCIKCGSKYFVKDYGYMETAFGISIGSINPEVKN